QGAQQVPTQACQCCGAAWPAVLYASHQHQRAELDEQPGGKEEPGALLKDQSGRKSAADQAKGNSAAGISSDPHAMGHHGCRNRKPSAECVSRVRLRMIFWQRLRDIESAIRLQSGQMGSATLFAKDEKFARAAIFENEERGER